jgi:Ca2+-binding RTX toxin-like protein
MATFKWSALVHGAVIGNFNKDSDVLDFDIAVSAASISLARSGGVAFTHQGKTVVISNLVPEQLTTTNVTFSRDQSRLVVGDNSSGVAADSLGNNIIGTDKDDQLHALDGLDTVIGNAGADLIYGNGDADTLLGGAGNDRILAGSGADLIYGNADADEIEAGQGNDTSFGGQGDDIIEAGDGGNDVIFGGVGNDNLFGGNGNDTIYGGSENDLISPGLGTNLVYGNQGADDVGSFGTNDTLYGGQGNDTVSGFGASSLIYGNRENDFLRGGDGNDTLYGGQGNDTLNGGEGKDVLTGGVAGDIFNFRMDTSPLWSGVTTNTADLVRDFVTGQDKIGIGAAAAAGTYNEVGLSFVDTVEEAVTAYNGNTTGANTKTFIAGSADGYLIIDLDGNKTADSVIVLKGLTQLSGFDNADVIG